jgi:hypothetical protein
VAASEPVTVGGNGGNVVTGSTGTAQIGGANQSSGSTGTVQSGPVGLGSGGSAGGGGQAGSEPGTRTLASASTPAAGSPRPLAGDAVASAGRRGVGGLSLQGGSRPLTGAKVGHSSQTTLAARVLGSVLPFTGIALALWALLGLVSLVLGAGVWRSSVALS